MADTPRLSLQALRELRAHKAAASHRTAVFTTGGVPKPHPQPKAKITLRRADYEREKAGG